LITAPTDEAVVDLLHAAFHAIESDEAQDTLLGAVGDIDSDVVGRILHLGSGNGNMFHSVPLDLDTLRQGIREIMVEGARSNEHPVRPDDVAEAEWNAMDEATRMEHVVEDLRPMGLSLRQWQGMEPRTRAARAMEGRIAESDFRGSLSDGPPCGVEAEDLAILARVMMRISPTEMHALVRRGYHAAGIRG